MRNVAASFMIKKILLGSWLSIIFGGSLLVRTSKVKIGTSLNHRGQVAVEYVLLLAVGVGIWLVLVSGLVSRNPNSPGLVIRKWVEIIQFIGSDEVEKTN